jgi:hypothetical protein
MLQAPDVTTPSWRAWQSWIAALLVAAPAGASSLSGTEFWFAWPPTADVTVDDPRYDLDGQLVLVAESAPVTVTVTGPGLSTTVTAAPGAPALVRVPRAAAMVTQEHVPVAAGIHLVSASCARFAALFRVPGSGASVGDDVARLLPVDMLGTLYLPVAYWGGSEVIVVAVEDGTAVTIADPTCPTAPPVTLARGQAVLHRCTAARGDGDVTGTLVRASAPVAVMSGCEHATIINHEGTRPDSRLYWGWEDVLLESPWPVELLGASSFHAPFRRENPAASGDLVRLVAACPSTRVDVQEAGMPATSRSFVAAGDHADLETLDLIDNEIDLVRESVHLTSARTFQAAAFTVGNLNAHVGDPSLLVLDPQDQWERSVLAYLPDGTTHSLGITCPTSATASVRLDGLPVPGTWRPAGDGLTHSWLRLDDVAAGEHRVEAAEPIFVEVSGYLPQQGGRFPAGAYSYPAVPLRPDGQFSVDVLGVDRCLPACPGDCLTLALARTHASHAWFVDGALASSGPELTLCPPGSSEVTVLVTSASGCSGTGRARVTVGDTFVPPPIQGPSRCCVGSCVTLAAPAGYDRYEWETGETTRFVEVCPAAATTYRVRVSDVTGCGTAEHRVSTYPPPVAGAASVSSTGACSEGLTVSWEAAAWRPGSPGGVYDVYRRAGTCAPRDDASWQLVATGLSASPHRDATAQPGIAYSYLVEAEDAPAPGPCDPGPAQGGSTAAACAAPEAVMIVDPDAGRLVSLSPHLRGTSYERLVPAGPASAATFDWSRAPALDPATHVEVWRSDRADALLPVELRAAGTAWRDADAGASWLLFYEVVNATDCGTRGD